MPRLSRWMVRCALAYLIIGVAIGGLMLLAKAGLADARLLAWILPHADMLVVGWLVQMAMGMGFWILPRIRVAGRGRVALAWAAWVCLNAGLVLGAGLALLAYWFPGDWMRTAFSAGILLQAAAMGLYALYAWPRILPTITAADLRRK